MYELSSQLTWSDNIWMGVTVETKDYYNRINLLREVPARIRFLSLEPLLGAMPGLKLKDVDWVVVGGESGPNARLMKAEWVKSIRAQCNAADIAFFFKQWGGKNKKAAGRRLDGRTYDDMPVGNLMNKSQIAASI
jgi:protein gp37